MSADARPLNPRQERNRRLMLQAGTVLILLLVWILATEVFGVDPLFIPGLDDLGNRFVAMAPQLPSALGYSLVIILGGFLTGCAAGVLVALLMAYSAIVRESIEPIVNALRPMPIFALIPLFLLWFGIGYGSQIGLVSFGCFVILVVSTSEAIKNVPAIYVSAGRTLGASRGRLFSTIVFPAIIPNLVGALRVAAAASFGLDVAAEFIGAQDGLGYLLINSQAYLYTDGIILVVIIYTILAFLLDRLVLLSTKGLTRWAERSQH